MQTAHSLIHIASPIFLRGALGALAWSIGRIPVVLGIDRVVTIDVEGLRFAERINVFRTTSDREKGPASTEAGLRTTISGFLTQALRRVRA